MGKIILLGILQIEDSLGATIQMMHTTLLWGTTMQTIANSKWLCVMLFLIACSFKSDQDFANQFFAEHFDELNSINSILFNTESPLGRIERDGTIYGQKNADIEPLNSAIKEKLLAIMNAADIELIINSSGLVGTYKGVHIEYEIRRNWAGNHVTFILHSSEYNFIEWVKKHDRCVQYYELPKKDWFVYILDDKGSCLSDGELTLL
jgi:hypothetical protein